MQVAERACGPGRICIQANAAQTASHLARWTAQHHNPTQAHFTSSCCNAALHGPASVTDSCLPLLQQRWQQRLDRADTLLQQQTERSRTLASGQDASISQLRSQVDTLNQTVQSLDGNLSALKVEKSSLSAETERLRDDQQFLQGERERLRGLVEELQRVVKNVTQALHQVIHTCRWPSTVHHGHLCHHLKQQKPSISLVPPVQDFIALKLLVNAWQ